MPPLAIACVLIAAVVHAIWNLLVKRAVGSRHFVCLYSLASIVLWAPAMGYVLASSGMPKLPGQWLALAATGILHLGYALALQAGYRTADLSVVYPIARGAGPLLSFIGAVVLLGEPCTLTSVLGLVLILAGIGLVSGLVGRARRIELNGVGWGLLTGSFIAAYTLNDGWAVRLLLVSPILVDFSGNVIRFAALAPAAIRDRVRLRLEARQYFWPAVGVGALAPLGYVLVLFAMRVAPVSHVAPARELATLVGAYLGARFLAEAVTGARVIGAAAIVAGIACLAMARY